MSIESISEKGFKALSDNSEELVCQAQKSAIECLPKNAGNQEKGKVARGISRRFGPYVKESTIIAEGLSSEEYNAYKTEIIKYLGADIGAVTCPDGRILSVSFTDPLITRVNRRLAGLPETRKMSGDDDNYVLADPDITANINFSIRKKQINGAEPIVVEFFGPHIFSTQPEHGCGAAKHKTTQKGRPSTTAMRFGGVMDYFNELGAGFEAFNNTINQAGGRGVSYDMTHDIYSQGLIFGLKQVYDEKGEKMFSESLSLRGNLIRLHREKKILMTELMDNSLRLQVQSMAREMGGPQVLDLRDPSKLAGNSMIIGRIAKNLTERQENKGFPWIPDHMRTNKPDEAVRTLAYHAIRNSVYRILGDIIPGNHALIKHPEQLIRVGPGGASYNVKTIPFVQVTPPEELRPTDIKGTERLYNISEAVLTGKNINLKREARVVVTTGRYNINDYTNPHTKAREFERVASVVNNNMSTLRDVFCEGTRSGETVVIGAIYSPESKHLTHIVK